MKKVLRLALLITAFVYSNVVLANICDLLPSAFRGILATKEHRYDKTRFLQSVKDELATLNTKRIGTKNIRTADPAALRAFIQERFVGRDLDPPGTFAFVLSQLPPSVQLHFLEQLKKSPRQYQIIEYSDAFLVHHFDPSVRVSSQDSDAPIIAFYTDKKRKVSSADEFLDLATIMTQTVFELSQSSLGPWNSARSLVDQKFKETMIANLAGYQITLQNFAQRFPLSSDTSAKASNARQILMSLFNGASRYFKSGLEGAAAFQANRPSQLSFFIFPTISVKWSKNRPMASVEQTEKNVSRQLTPALRINAAFKAAKAVFIAATVSAAFFSNHEYAHKPSQSPTAADMLIDALASPILKDEDSLRRFNAARDILRTTPEFFSTDQEYQQLDDELAEALKK